VTIVILHVYESVWSNNSSMEPNHDIICVQNEVLMVRKVWTWEMKDQMFLSLKKTGLIQSCQLMQNLLNNFLCSSALYLLKIQFMNETWREVNWSAVPFLFCSSQLMVFWVCTQLAWYICWFRILFRPLKHLSSPPPPPPPPSSSSLTSPPPPP
jgi:hypothetical protein